MTRSPGLYHIEADGVGFLEYAEGEKMSSDGGVARRSARMAHAKVLALQPWH